MAHHSDSILIVTQYFPPETGAAATRWEELSKRWSEAGPVTVLTSAPDYPSGELYDGFDNRWVRVEERDGVRVLYTKTVTSPSGNLLRRAVKFVWFMLVATVVGLRYTSPGHVVATSPQPLTGVAAWIVARVKGAQFVFEVRDLWPDSITAVSEFDTPVVIRGLERTVRFLYRRADLLVVVSRAFVDSIVSEGVDEGKVSYHPNGIDPGDYDRAAECGEPGATSGARPSESPASGEQPFEVGVDVPAAVTESFTVSYVGTIGRAHGLSVLVPVAERLPAVQFLLVGDGARRDALAAETAHLDNVHLVGRRPKAEVPAFLAAADAALVHLEPRPVFETVIPTKLLEAMAAGLPVLLGVRGEARRILDEADAGIAFEPGNADELAATIGKLQDDVAQCNTYGENGRTYVVERFAWDAIARDYRADIVGTRVI